MPLPFREQRQSRSFVFGTDADTFGLGYDYRLENRELLPSGLQAVQIVFFHGTSRGFSMQLSFDVPRTAARIYHFGLMSLLCDEGSISGPSRDASANGYMQRVLIESDRDGGSYVLQACCLKT